MKKILQKKIRFLPINKNNKSNIKIHDFYIELINEENFEKTIQLQIEKDSKNNSEFDKIIKKLVNNKIVCLLKLGLSWYKILINKISEIIIEIKIIFKIIKESILKKINNLIRIVNQLNDNGSSKKTIHNYITHYFEYNFKLDYN